MANEFDKAIEAIKSGEVEFGRQLLLGLLKTDRNNVTLLLWLTQTGLTIDQTENILQRILLIDPNNTIAKSGLKKIEAQKAGTYTPLPKPKPDAVVPARKSLLQSSARVSPTGKSAISTNVPATINGVYVLELLSLRDEQDGDDLFRVHGQVKNISDKNLESVVAEIELYDKAGKLIRVADFLLARQMIGPGQTSVFDIVTTNDSRIDRYAVTFRRLFSSTIPTIDNR